MTSCKFLRQHSRLSLQNQIEGFGKGLAPAGSMNFLILFAILATSAFAQESALSVLTNRGLTIQEREDFVTSFSEAPLSRDEALVELCYQVDLCAQESSETDVKKLCTDAADLDNPERNFFGDSCTVRRFRKNHSCHPSIDKLKVQTVDRFLDIIEDSSSTYMSYIGNSLVRILSGIPESEVNLCEVPDIIEEFEKFQKEHPKQAEAIQKMAENFPSLGMYTTDCYQSMNQFLFRKDEKSLQRYFNLFRATLDSLSILPDYKGKVNRGVALPEAILKEHKIVGNSVCYNGFTSTAAHIAKDYGSNPRNSFLNGCNQRLYITQPQNSSHFGKDIDGISKMKGEKEILFSPGACFRIEKVTPRADIGTNEELKQCPQDMLLDIEMTLIN